MVDFIKLLRRHLQSLLNFKVGFELKGNSSDSGLSTITLARLWQSDRVGSKASF